VQQKPKDIDHYLAMQTEPRRATLQKLRHIIRRKVPGVVECISYSMPAFRLNGDVIAGFLATSKGCSYYPFSGSALAGLTRELAGYGGTTSAVHFAANRCLPAALVERLLKARIAEAVKRRAAKALGKVKAPKKPATKIRGKTTAKKMTAEQATAKKVTARRTRKATGAKAS
jgi:uncharacterized protein YdhG (YjbR/CyaY superfamily)